MPPAALVLEAAREAGFDLAALGPAAVPARDAAAFRAWLGAGAHGGMAWLARAAGRILDPQRVLPGARSILALALDYTRAACVLPGGGRIARYAVGRDYHRVFRARQRRLLARLTAEGWIDGPARAGADAIPLLERALAAAAGLGFQAKSTGLIHPRRGPWLLLGEVLLSVEFEVSPPAAGSCGSCRACLDACPTGALAAPFRLDARLCLSYTTIEHRGPIPRPLRAPQGAWVFGCDVCIEVCPYTRFGRGPAGDPDFAVHEAVERHTTADLVGLARARFDALFRGTALRRAGFYGLRRNAAIACGNLGLEEAVPALVAALEEPDAGLRAAAAWALARLGSGRPAIERALRRERDPALARDLEASLTGQP